MYPPCISPGLLSRRLSALISGGMNRRDRSLRDAFFYVDIELVVWDLDLGLIEASVNRSV